MSEDDGEDVAERWTMPRLTTQLPKGRLKEDMAGKLLERQVKDTCTAIKPIKLDSQRKLSTCSTACKILLYLL